MIEPSRSEQSQVETRAQGSRSRNADRKKSYGATAKRGALWSMFRQGGNELIGIPTSMITARIVAPQDFGVAAASAFFIHLAARLTQFGFGAALVRIKDMRPEHVSSVYVATQAMGLLTFAALFALAPAIGEFYRSPEAGSLLRVAALSFAITPLGTVPAALLQRRMQFRYTTLADWTDTLIGAIVTVVLALRGFGFWSFVYGHLTALVIRVCLQLYLARWSPTVRFSRAALRELLPMGLGLQTKRLLEYAASNLDSLIVGRVLGMAALGFYDKAFNTMNKIVFRLTLGHAPFRIFSIIHEDTDRFRRAYSRLIVSVTLLGYPVLAGCIVVAEPLFLVLYGERWRIAVLPFQLLCAGGMLKLLNAYASQANEAVGNIWPQTRRQAVGTVLVVLGAAIGSSYAGVTGAALGVLLAWAVMTVALQDLVRQATGLSWTAMVRLQIPAATCASLLVIVVLGLDAGVRRWVAEPAPWLLLLVQGGGGGVFYLTFLLFSPFAAVRDIVTETVDDLAPARLRALVHRRKPLSGV